MVDRFLQRICVGVCVGVCAGVSNVQAILSGLHISCPQKRV